MRREPRHHEHAIHRPRPVRQTQKRRPDRRQRHEGLFRNEELRRLLTEGEGRDDDADLRVDDAAYWRKGCSSL